MRNIASFISDNPIYGWIIILVCIVGGWHGISTIGRLEDPPFPIKVAYVITPYPGASAEEVELEVTDKIEDAIQELPYIQEMTSKSVPGRSEIQIELLEEFGLDETPQIFDELRRKIRESEIYLPPGVNSSLVEDDFGDVFGVLYGIKTDGFSHSETQDLVKSISTKLKLVPGVAKVTTRGLPEEAIYLEFEETKLNRIGLSVEEIAGQIWLDSQVMFSGSTVFEGRRLRIAQSNAKVGVLDLKQMRIGSPGSTEIVFLGDLAKIQRTKIENPREIVRVNGEDVAVLAISVTPGQNVVAVGEKIDRSIKELRDELAIGVEVFPIYRQHIVVDGAITNFLKNLIISVLTVSLALNLFMGWRAGTVVGAVLLLTVLGTIEVMNILGVELQRISLGALMISMGMLVDNAIVIAEGMVIGVKQGLSPREAAAKSVSRTQYPLVCATIIGILAFAPISLSDDNSGHFLISLFQVVAISLLLSWFLAITIIPLLGGLLLKNRTTVTEQELYKAWYFFPYKRLLRIGLRNARVGALAIVLITSAGLFSMQYVQQGFFPSNNNPLFYVDYRLQEGTDINATSADIMPLEKMLRNIEGIKSVTTFVGIGPPRFTAITQPEQPNPAYAHMIVEVADVEDMNGQMIKAQTSLMNLRPDSEIQVRRAEFSPGGGSKIEMRYSGPDIKVLRQLSEETSAIFLKHELIDRKTDWRPQSLQLVPAFNEEKARMSGITKQDLANSLAYNTLGLTVGMIRDGDKILPIVARAPALERQNIAGMQNKSAWSETHRNYVPINQLVNEFKLESENTTIYRRDGIRTLTVQANQPKGHNVNEYFKNIRKEIESIELPFGYAREWGGEFESNKMAYESLGERIPLAFCLMFFVTILMFGSLKQPIVIWLTVPMVLCGVAIGLLITNLPLTFPSFLGILSLAGMLIKNCIILVDEIDKRLSEGEASLFTLEIASLSRLRPVMLAALTTIFGMSPLLTDAFFREMAVSIMSGLAFATILTLFAVPVFYRIALGKRVA